MYGKHRPWTTREEMELRRMVRINRATHLIARDLDRTVRAINSYCAHLGLRRRRQRVVQPKGPVTYVSAAESIRIMKAEVTLWYELGWRFIGFDHGLCVFEWPHASEPMRPVEMMREAA